jgi:hypothetical protein
MLAIEGRSLEFFDCPLRSLVGGQTSVHLRSGLFQYSSKQVCEDFNSWCRFEHADESGHTNMMNPNLASKSENESENDVSQSAKPFFLADHIGEGVNLLG